jgi:hypothetical protein
MSAGDGHRVLYVGSDGGSVLSCRRATGIGAVCRRRLASWTGMDPVQWLDSAPISPRLAGISTTAELVGSGVTPDRIRQLVGAGQLKRLGRGVYARADLASSVASDRDGDRLLRLAAVLAIVGPRAVASHQDAAILHGLALLDRPKADEFTVTCPRGVTGHRTGRAGLRVHMAWLPDGHLVVRNKVPATSVARTVIDLARTTPFRSGVAAADCALHGGTTSKAELRSVIATCARWPGIDRARRVVDFSDSRSESPFESISRVAFRDAGLPAPELQVWVGGPDRVVGRVDFLWREHRTIAEADGALKYADPERARSQLRRDAALREAGFEVVHFGWHELAFAPDQVVRSIRAAFDRAGALRASERAGRGSG